MSVVSDVDHFEWARFLVTTEDICYPFLVNGRVKIETEVDTESTGTQYQGAVRELCSLTELLIGLLNGTFSSLFHSFCASSGEET
jgi:hypothetical protein